MEMGRHREYKNKVGITAYLEAEEYEALEQIRWRDRKDLTEIVRLACLEYIRAHGNGNAAFKLDNWQQDPNFKAAPTALAKDGSWNKYLAECTVKERKDWLAQFNNLRKIAATSGPLK